MDALAPFPDVKSLLHAIIRALYTNRLQPGQVWRNCKVHVNCLTHFVNFAVLRSNRNLPGKPGKDNAKQESISLNLVTGLRGKGEISFIPGHRIAHRCRTCSVRTNCYFKVRSDFRASCYATFVMILRGFSPREGSNGCVRVTLSPTVVTEKNFPSRSLTLSRYFRHDIRTFGKLFDTKPNNLTSPAEAITLGNK